MAFIFLSRNLMSLFSRPVLSAFADPAHAARCFAQWGYGLERICMLTEPALDAWRHNAAFSHRFNANSCYAWAITTLHNTQVCVRQQKCISYFAQFFYSLLLS